jgi:LuxR family maltose regulon positive regulatory protein
VRLVERNALAMLDAGRLTTLESWLKSLPQDLVRSQPWISLSRAWALAYAGEWDQVKPLLASAEQALARRCGGEPEGSDAAEGRRIAGHIAAIRSYGTFIEGDLSAAASMALEALAQLSEEDLRPRRFMKALGAAVHRLQGDLVAAEAASVEAVTISRAEGDLHVRVMVLGDLGALQIARGQLRRADRTFRDALQLADEYAGHGGRRLPAMGYIYTHMGRLEREWNNLQAAEQHASAGTELCQQWGLAEILTGSHVYMAAVLQAMGEADGALAAMQQAKKVAAELSPWYADRAAAFEAQLHLALGDIETAAAWLEGAALIPAGDVPFQRELEYRIAAQVLLAQGRLDEALALLLQLQELTEGAGAIYALIEVLLLRVVALVRQGQTEAAQSELERALSLAEPHGFVRVFVDRGSALAEPLEAAAAGGIAPAYVRRLLTALQKETIGDQQRPTTIAPPVVRRPPSPLIEPLSERELEVLRLLTTHLSSTEIAEQLFVSVHTVRSHVKSIYGKLNVHRRIEAIERAKELGLL